MIENFLCTWKQETFALFFKKVVWAKAEVLSIVQIKNKFNLWAKDYLEIWNLE